MIIQVKSTSDIELRIGHMPDSFGNNYLLSVIWHGVFVVSQKALSLRLCGSALVADDNTTFLLRSSSDIRVVQQFIEDTQP